MFRVQILIFVLILSYFRVYVSVNKMSNLSIVKTVLQFKLRTSFRLCIKVNL